MGNKTGIKILPGDTSLKKFQTNSFITGKPLSCEITIDVGEPLLRAVTVAVVYWDHGKKVLRHFPLMTHGSMSIQIDINYVTTVPPFILFFETSFGLESVDIFIESTYDLSYAPPSYEDRDLLDDATSFYPNAVLPRLEVPQPKYKNLQSSFSSAEVMRSPLTLDLDGDGVETIPADSGVYFDHDGNGFAEKSGWVSKDDAILVRDLNNNGQIDDGSELFGDQTILSDGTEAANGFEALADLDSNQDGIFDGDDEAFGEVKVWQDKNGNGVVDDGELKTLNEAGITSINLNYEHQSVTDEHGNVHSQTGTFTRTDGTSGTITDVWFDADYADTVDLTDVVISDEIALLPEVEGFGNVHNLQTAMALDTTGELKGLVQQYASTTNRTERDGILTDLIYTWAGVIDVDPESRATSGVHGNAIGDARKLETLEEFLGEEYLGTWCWGERDPNPHGHAAPILLDAFEQ